MVIIAVVVARQSKGLRGSPDSVLYQFFFCEKRVMDIPSSEVNRYVLEYNIRFCVCIR